MDAWQRNDYMALHRAVGLAPLEYSPLPYPLEALGIPATPPAKPETCMELSYAKVKAIQDELYAVAGEPGVLPMPRGHSHGRH